jgi:hypothetical protein
MVNEPPIPAEVEAMQKFHVYKFGIAADLADNYVPVHASAAPAQVLRELSTIDSDMQIAIDTDIARWAEKFENDVGIAWSTNATDLLAKYSDFKNTPEGAKAKFGRVTFTQVATQSGFSDRVDVRAGTGTAKVAAGPALFEEKISVWASDVSEEDFSSVSAVGPRAIKADLGAARVGAVRVLRAAA